MFERRSKPDWQKKIAEERINILFREAEIEYKNDPKLSHRYVFLARKIAMKYNLKLPSELKRKFCKQCHHYLFPGKNCIVRTNQDTQCVESTCLDCKHINRFGY